MIETVNFKLLMRWAFRDLHKRKLQVVAIALIIGIGTGAFVGLSSTTKWRQYAFDESNELLNMFDLKMQLLPGSWINQTELIDFLHDLPHYEWIHAFEVRTSFSTSINISTSTNTILAKGRIIGINVEESSNALKVNGINVTEGRHIQASEAESDVGIVEYNFAKYHNLHPNNQKITIPGNIKIAYIGTGLTPEYFMVVEENIIMAEASFCALFVPLKTAQAILQSWLGLPSGFVNEVLFSFSDNIDSNILQNEIIDNFNDIFPTLNLEFIEKEESNSYKFQKEDIPGDQALYTIFSFLILFVAAFGTFNIVSRVVSSHRREIGINMALGVPPRQISYRYLIFSLEIAIGGVFFGLMLALIIGERLGSVIEQISPYPIWKEWLVTDLFLQGTLLGILMPLLACIIPIWRACRLRPIQAIHTGYSISTGKGIAPLLERIPFPGSIFVQLPFRNLARNLRRTFSTLFGIALAICVLVAVFSFVDGGNFLLSNEEKILRSNSPTRVDIIMNDFYNASLSPVTNITNHPDVQMASPAIKIPVKMHSSNNKTFDIILNFLSLENNIWSPLSHMKGSMINNLEKGIVISQKTAKDLHSNIGDNITIQHMFRESQFHYSEKNTSFRIIGIYPSQVRFWVFTDIINSHLINCTDLTNIIMVVPKTEISEHDIQEDFFNIQGYNGIQSTTQLVEAYDKILELFTSIFNVLQYIVTVLALLLAYNTNSINIDERTRELATMGSFGTPIRTSTRILMVESLITGVIGTVLGFFPLGIIVNSVLQTRVDETMPEIYLAPHLFPISIVTIIVIGVVLVTLSPLLSIRKLIKMDLPSALRVVE